MWEPRDHLSEHLERRPSRVASGGDLVMRNEVNFWMGGVGSFVVCAALGWLVLLDPGAPASDPDQLSAQETWLFLAAVALSSMAAALAFLNASVRSDGRTLTVNNPLRTHVVALPGVQLDGRPALRWGFPRLTLHDGDTTRTITVWGLEQSLSDTMSGGSESLALLQNEVELAARDPQRAAAIRAGVTSTWHRPSRPVVAIALYWAVFLTLAARFV